MRAFMHVLTNSTHDITHSLTHTCDSHDANNQYFDHRKTSAVPRVKTGDIILASKSMQASKSTHAKMIVNVAGAVTVVFSSVITPYSILALHGIAVSAADVTAIHVRAPVICHDFEGA